jgi:hypothetical protein
MPYNKVWEFAYVYGVSKQSIVYRVIYKQIHVYLTVSCLEIPTSIEIIVTQLQLQSLYTIEEKLILNVE